MPPNKSRAIIESGIRAAGVPSLRELALGSLGVG